MKRSMSVRTRAALASVLGESLLVPTQNFVCLQQFRTQLLYSLETARLKLRLNSGIIRR